MTVYVGTLAVWLLANATLAYKRRPKNLATGDTPVPPTTVNHAASKFKYTFFTVYILVVASDWLQGPYLYPLYRETLQLSEKTIAALFSAGFVSGAVSATFVGSLADRYGRQKACLAFCAIYALSCLLTITPRSVYLLLLGRLLGGIGTTLLFTAFETWLVSEFHRSELVKEIVELNDLLGAMTMLNSIVAVVAGLFSELLVGWTGSRTSPFIASIFCLAIASLRISRNWRENYGDERIPKDNFTATQLLGGISALLRVDKRIMVLGLASAVFEGTMYLFVVFWSPAIISALKTTYMVPLQSPPFGLIFASFMAAMVFGSQLFRYLMHTPGQPASEPGCSVSTILRSSHALKLVLPVAGACLSWSVLYPTETSTLWAFCIYEMTIGIYFPSIGVLKSLLVEDSHRATIYALFRVPLNCFVVAGLALTTEGDGYRNTVFLSCSGLLLVAMAFVDVFI
ncbi:hypothetical protein LOZ53_001040 [Ophidiomyces ophidiicola]|nr:hypothetical protein LOZ53_001040 [Ophidiomyces ophidiicola]